MKSFLTIGLAAVMLAGGITQGADLWKEDGSNLQISKTHSTKAWYNGEIAMKKAPEGGFVISSNVAHYLTYYPGNWLELDLRKSEKIKHKGYTSWSVSMPELGSVLSIVNKVPEGIYTIRMPKDAGKAWGAMVMRSYNYNLHFKSIRLAQSLENSVDVETFGKKELKEGDKVKITLRLKDPCEDVTCLLYGDEGRGLTSFSINGSNTVSLKPEDKAGRIWSSEFTIKSYDKHLELGKRSVLVKCQVLGGSVKTPLFGNFIPAFLWNKKK